MLAALLGDDHTFCSTQMPWPRGQGADVTNAISPRAHRWREEPAEASEDEQGPIKGAIRNERIERHVNKLILIDGTDNNQTFRIVIRRGRSFKSLLSERI